MVEDTKKESKLFEKFNWILILHIVLLVTVALDICPFPYVTLEITKLIKFDLQDFFTYDEGVLISSLLVVWTFLTAIIIYYLGRKDEKFCGLRNSQVIFGSVHEKKILYMGIIFLAELLLLLFSAIIHLPITLVAFAIILPITTFYVFWMVMQSTDDQVLKLRLKQMIQNSVRKKNDTIHSVLLQWDYSQGESLSVLREILKVYFNEIVKNSEAWSYKEELEHIRVVFEKLSDHGEQRKFFKILVGDMAKNGKAKTNVDVFTIFLCGGLQYSENYAISFCRDLVAAIEENDIRRQLILRGIVYNKYIETCTGKRNRQLVQNELRNLLHEGISKEEQKNTLLFMQELCHESNIKNFYWSDILELF